MNHFKLYFVFFISLTLGLFLSSTTVWASKSNLVTELNNYAQTNENADFKKIDLKGNNLIVYIEDDYVEAVNDYGLESYLEDTYKQIAKSSYAGKGWFKSTDTTNEKYNFNFKTGDVD